MPKKTTKKTPAKIAAKKGAQLDKIAELEKAAEPGENAEVEIGDETKDLGKRNAELVRKMIKKFESTIDTSTFKVTVGDIIRLLQMERERQEERPREIKVTWVEPEAKENTTKE